MALFAENKSIGEIIDLLREGSHLDLGSSWKLCEQLVQVLGADPSSPRYRIEGSASPSCTASDCRHYDTGIGILEIRQPYDSFWFEAQILEGEDAECYKDLSGHVRPHTSYDEDLRREISSVKMMIREDLECFNRNVCNQDSEE